MTNVQNAVSAKENRRKKSRVGRVSSNKQIVFLVNVSTPEGFSGVFVVLLGGFIYCVFGFIVEVSLY